MATYALHYDRSNGDILSYTIAAYGQSSDLFVNNIPSNFSTERYRVKIDSDTSSPLDYIIDRVTGYAYDIDAVRVSDMDEDPDPEAEEIDDDLGLSARGVSIGGGGSNTTTPGQSSASADEDEAVAAALTGISSGGVLANISLPKDEWVVSDGQYVFSIASETITDSTVVHVLGVDRSALTAHIYWTSEAGLLTFKTALQPSNDIIINAELRETGDSWQAKGVIEAWPGAGLVSKRYRESLYHSESDSKWPFVLTARGTENDTKTILTKVGFADANLLFATPEWTGNTHVIIPHVFVQDATKRLCYTLTNMSDDEVEISEVAIRLLYNGVISNLEVDENDTSSLDGYIERVDIDELDE